MTTVYGFVPFDRSGRVRWLLHELNVPFDDHWLSFSKGDAQEPAFLAVSPLGKVPALRDGDATLFESSAILTYVAQKYGADTPWHPSGHNDAEYACWMAWASSTLDPPCFEFVRPDTAEVDRLARKAQAARIVGRCLDALAPRIAAHGATLSTGLSPIDIQVVASMNYAEEGGMLKGRPVLKEWLDGMRARPAAAAAKLFQS